MEQQIADSKALREFPSLDKYEEWLLDTIALEDAHQALGSLTVICADLLEQARRSDPAYGLTPVDSVTFRVDEQTFGGDSNE